MFTEGQIHQTAEDSRRGKVQPHRQPDRPLAVLSSEASIPLVSTITRSTTTAAERTRTTPTSLPRSACRLGVRANPLHGSHGEPTPHPYFETRPQNLPLGFHPQLVFRP